MRMGFKHSLYFIAAKRLKVAEISLIFFVNQLVKIFRLDIMFFFVTMSMLAPEKSQHCFVVLFFFRQHNDNHNRESIIRLIQ